MKAMVYIDPRQGEVDLDVILKSIGGTVEGLICDPLQTSTTDDGIQRILIPGSDEKLRELLVRGENIFLPKFLSESIGNYIDVMDKYQGQIWLEDSYISRFIATKYLSEIENYSEFLGFAGSSPNPRPLNNATRYSYIMSIQDGFVEQISRDILAGVDSIWIPFISYEQITRQFLKFPHLIETVELFSLFGKSVKMPIDKWRESRPCLAIKHSLSAGHRISEHDLCTVRDSAGLSVDLKNAIVGKCLRYSLPAQTILTFGMIEC
jgi:hypothetical protein